MLIGAGLAVVALRVDQGGPGAPVPTITTTAGPVTAAGIGDVVDGFPDGLITTVRADGRSLETLLWPVHGEPYQRTIPVGASNPPSPVAFDVSGRRLATLLPLPEEADGVLYAGIPENAEIVDVGVTGFAWHDSTLRALAYTTSVEGELLLWTARDDLSDPSLVTRATGIQGGVTEWGDWGFAVRDQGHDSTVLLSPDGEIETVQPGRVVTSHESGWLAVEDRGMALSIPGEELRHLQGLESVSGVLSAAFAPDRRKLAILTSNGLTVLSVDEDVVTHAVEERPGVAASIEWTSDSRFVVYPAFRGLQVLDIDSGAETRLLTTHSFTGVGILPLSGS